MGGELTVSSQWQQGSVFQFTIPLKLADALGGDSLTDPTLPEFPDLAAFVDNQPDPTAIALLTPAQPHTPPKFLLSYLSGMSHRWVTELNFAARSADSKAIAHLLEQIPESQTELKEAIAHLVYHFQLETLIQLTQAQITLQQTFNSQR